MSDARILSRLAGLLCLAPTLAWAQPQVLPGMTGSDIDTLVSGTQAAFNVPGVAVGIVKDGKVIFSRGYGHRRADENATVDEMTRFAIGSNTKAFTTAALSILVHQNKLQWSDPVWQHMPEFALADPYLTRAFIVTDLLTHHSGMGQGAGDLMLFSRSRFTRSEVVNRLQYMPFTGGFREKYAYNNLLYVTAGKLVEDISHVSWEHFVQHNILDATDMKACTTSPAKPKSGENRATGHSLDNGKAVPVAWEFLPAVAPAGGIECSLSGMESWVQMLLAHGVSNGHSVLAADQIDEMWAPHALLPLADSAHLTNTHFRAYGLGWFTEDFYGARRVWHTGTIQNMVSYVSFLPEKNVGIVILTNQDDHHATYTLATALSAAAMGHNETDWLAYFRKEAQDNQKAAAARDKADGPGSKARPFIALPASEMTEYTGTYHDRWRGDAVITQDSKGLRFVFGQADDLGGTLRALPHDLFVVQWDNRSRDGGDDSYVQFHRDMSGHIASISMAVVTSDFSFDVQDLNLKRVSH